MRENAKTIFTFSFPETLILTHDTLTFRSQICSPSYYVSIKLEVSTAFIFR